MLVALIYWQVTVPVVASVGAAYAIKTFQGQNPRAQLLEALREAVGAPEPKKRHWNRRIKVNHYQHGRIAI